MGIPFMDAQYDNLVDRAKDKARRDGLEKLSVGDYIKADILRDRHKRKPGRQKSVDKFLL